MRRNLETDEGARVPIAQHTLDAADHDAVGIGYGPAEANL